MQGSINGLIHDFRGSYKSDGLSNILYFSQSQVIIFLFWDDSAVLRLDADFMFKY